MDKLTEDLLNNKIKLNEDASTQDIKDCKRLVGQIERIALELKNVKLHMGEGLESTILDLKRILRNNNLI